MTDPKSDANNLSLYQTDWCPFCVRVRSAMSQLGVEVELRDIGEEREHLRALVDATGREMVPCLRIDSESGDAEWMHESAHIIAYLQERFA